MSGRTGQSARIQASSPHRAPTLCLLHLPWAFPSCCDDFALLHFVPELGYAQLRCIKSDFLTQDTCAEDASAQIPRTAVPELVMDFPGTEGTGVVGRGGGQTCWLWVKSRDCSSGHVSPDLPWLVRLTRGLGQGVAGPPRCGSRFGGSGSPGFPPLELASLRPPTPGVEGTAPLPAARRGSPCCGLSWGLLPVGPFVCGGS